MSKSSTGLNVGGSSILVIFVLLCLTTFSTLSMVSANADYKQTQKIVNSVKDYYAADETAEGVLMQIDNMINEEYTASGKDAKAFFDAIAKKSTDISPIAIDFSKDTLGDGMLSYNIPIDKTKSLMVDIKIYRLDAGKDKLYSINGWRVVTTAPIDVEEEPLKLFRPESEG